MRRIISAIMLFFMFLCGKECVAVCVALFCGPKRTDRTAWAAAGPGSDPHGELGTASLRLRQGRSGTPHFSHFTNPNFQLRVEVFDTSWKSVPCTLNTFVR